ncbi:carbohydrate-binding family 9-like protein [Polaribacter sp. 11A2H]|uniref:carbohydrate-binding family 9-like protein n=1 Tax=Polaribacter sp. 11A2H TaxID=2687290 RepID=UPI00140DE2B3|nr:carbohydrate-binding family 9-like protein [Polaribacter sp. 11A2H]
MKTYSVKYSEENDIVISGDGNNNIWNKADSLIDFTSPWNGNVIKKTTFKAVYNSEKIFFQFIVNDSLRHLHLSENKNDSINVSDRVELFFRSDASIDPYYCLEIDTAGRIMDFKAKPNKNFDFNWSWPSEDIFVKSSINKTNFIVEIAISLQSLEALNLLKNGIIETGIYRAKYHKQKEGTFLPTWITWVNPNTKTPNFHTPTSFGILKLERF